MTSQASAPNRRIAFNEFIVLMLKPIRWRWLLAPPLLLALEFLYVIFTETYGAHIKGILDDAALYILWAALVIALGRALIQRQAFLVWLSVLIGALLFREYHLMKIATGITYAIMVGLIIAAWLNYEVFQPYLRSSLTVTLLVVVGLTYVLTQTLDIDFFKYGDKANTIVEELMELTGHLMTVMLAILARPSKIETTSDAKAPPVTES
ncbi:MAG: hypothetical protein O7G85_05225 [Planctomycetota bacterium]|nr:hypothetical protein [Planctomycetota bacterium]